MNVTLSYNSSKRIVDGIQVTGSKSESNRLLILHALFPNIEVENLSHSDDTVVLAKAISKSNGTVDIHHAGTAMRFLTAYFAAQEGKEVVLTGSERMQERPIGILVDALRSLGANIAYTKNEGFPPLRIVGSKFTSNTVPLKANVSSQFISALMLVAPSLPNGLTILLEGEVTSVPYIKMTLKLLQQCGIEGEFEGNTVRVFSSEIVKSQTLVVESDWSSASYFYSIMALSDIPSITLKSYRKDSLQGDSALASIYEDLGVDTKFNENDQSIALTKSHVKLQKHLELNLVDTPDIAQTIAVSCFGLGMSCLLTGLHTLKIKETDRLQALKVELEKLGAKVEITENSLHLFRATTISEGKKIATYNDHRMTMAFAPLAIKQSLTILDSGVVSKSFPTFWEDLEKLGFEPQFK